MRDVLNLSWCLWKKWWLGNTLNILSRLGHVRKPHSLYYCSSCGAFSVVCCSFQLVQLLHCVCMFQDEEKDKTAHNTKELVRTINDRFKVRSVNCFCLLWIFSFCAYLCKTSCYHLCNKVEVGRGGGGGCRVWSYTGITVSRCLSVLITWILYFFIDILIIISGLCVCTCDFWLKSKFSCAASLGTPVSY